jgi:hypothetical protein
MLTGVAFSLRPVIVKAASREQVTGLVVVAAVGPIPRRLAVGFRTHPAISALARPAVIVIAAETALIVLLIATVTIIGLIAIIVVDVVVSIPLIA